MDREMGVLSRKQMNVSKFDNLSYFLLTMPISPRIVGKIFSSCADRDEGTYPAQCISELSVNIPSTFGLRSTLSGQRAITA